MKAHPQEPGNCRHPPEKRCDILIVPRSEAAGQEAASKNQEALYKVFQRCSLSFHFSRFRIDTYRPQFSGDLLIQLPGEQEPVIVGFETIAIVKEGIVLPVA